jgi:hypothetical protein
MRKLRQTEHKARFRKLRESRNRIAKAAQLDHDVTANAERLEKS